MDKSNQLQIGEVAATQYAAGKRAARRRADRRRALLKKLGMWRAAVTAEEAAEVDALFSRREHLRDEKAQLDSRDVSAGSDYVAVRRALKPIEAELIEVEAKICAMRGDVHGTTRGARDTATAEPKEARENRRLKACQDAGLPMPTTEVGRMPYGVGKLAEAEGVSRQSFTADLRAAIKRHAKIRAAGRVHRTE